MTKVGKIAYNLLEQEEEAKNKNRKFDDPEDQKTITMEVVSEDLIDKMEEKNK